MSQHDFNIANQTFPSFRADLNDALQASATMSAGSSAPTTPYAYQLWFDTTTDTWKVRNSGNTAWISTITTDLATGNVGIGTSSPAANARLNIADSGETKINVTSSGIGKGTRIFLNNQNGQDLEIICAGDTSGVNNIGIASNSQTGVGASYAMSGNTFVVGTYTAYPLVLGTNNAEAMRISGGNVLVGKTALNTNSAGLQLESDGYLSACRDGGNVALINRKTSDGAIMTFQKDGTTVGSIGVASTDNFYFAAADGAGLKVDSDLSSGVTPCNSSGADLDASINIGHASARWNNLYLSGGVYLGGTAAANHLDDYEEGTWTPTVSTASSHAVQTGIYTKIGNLVNIQCQVQFVQSGTVFGSVSGLPFTVAAINYSGITFREWYSTGVTLSGNLTIGSQSTTGFWNYANSSAATNGQTYGYGFSISYRT